MHFEHTAKVRALIARLDAFMTEHIYPVEKVYAEEVAASENPWRTPMTEDVTLRDYVRHSIC